MAANDHTWLAAEYHMPALYSCRVPMTSPLSGRALPAPGPATIQLALLRVGFELFGRDRVCNELFPPIVAGHPLVQPPAEIAISDQLTRAYKANESGRLDEGLAYRECAHANGVLTIYMSVPTDLVGVFTKLFTGIGYWGQTNSFAVCVDVRQAEPEPGTYARPLESFGAGQPLGQYHTSFVTELRDEWIKWAEVDPEGDDNKSDALRVRLYVWPLIICERSSTGQRLQYRSLLPAPSLDANPV